MDEDTPSPPITMSIRDRRIFLQQEFLKRRPSHAGICHSTTLVNKYFTAALPTWVDEFSYFDGISAAPDAPSRTQTPAADPDAMDTGSTTNLGGAVDNNANAVEDITFWANAYTSDDADVRSVRDSLVAVIYTFSPFTPFPYHTRRNMFDKIDNPAMAGSTALAQAQAEAEVEARESREREDAEHLDTLAAQVRQVLRLLDKLEAEGWDGIFLAVCRDVRATVTAGEQLPYFSEQNMAQAVARARDVTRFVREDVLGDTLYETVDLNEGADNKKRPGEPLGMARVKDVLGTHVALAGWNNETGENEKEFTGATGIGTIYVAPRSESVMDCDEPEQKQPLLDPEPPTPVAPVRPGGKRDSSSSGSSGGTSAMVTPTSGTMPYSPKAPEAAEEPAATLSSDKSMRVPASSLDPNDPDYDPMCDSYSTLSVEIDKMYKEAVGRTGLRMPLADPQSWAAAIGASRRAEDQMKRRGEGSDVDVRDTVALAEQIRKFRGEYFVIEQTSNTNYLFREYQKHDDGGGAGSAG